MQSVVCRAAVVCGGVGLLLFASGARAAPRRDTSGPLFVHTDSGQQAGAQARAQVAKGDCAGALDAFDAAVGADPLDPSLRRDRGLCHEQLAHPFPAIDDYRAYLTAAPDAADVEQIRERLVRLEESAGVGGPGAKAEATADSPPETKDGSARGRSSVEAGASLSASAGTSAGASVEADGTTSGSSGTPAKRGRDYVDEEDNWRKWQKAESSGLRRGSGDIIGAYFGVRRLTDFTDVSSYAVGATIRKSLGAVSTIWGEIGYVNYKGSNSFNFLGTALNAGSAASQIDAGGIALALGYEARFRLDQLTTNAIFVGGGLEFQHLGDRNSEVSSSHFLPRGKVGYRHVFGPAFGLELAVDAGHIFGVGSTLVLPNSTMYGGTVALVVAF